MEYSPHMGYSAFDDHISYFLYHPYSASLFFSLAAAAAYAAAGRLGDGDRNSGSNSSESFLRLSLWGMEE